MRISCLHMNEANIAAYEAAAPEGVSLTHFVRSELLYRARDGVGPGVAAETNLHLARIRSGADAALLTCSMLATAVTPPGFAADQLLAEYLAEEAKGERIDILFSNLSAEASIRQSFAALGPETGFVPVHDALERLMSGDVAGHDALVRAAVAESTADRIVLLQGPMAAASDDPRVVRAPQAALGRLAALIARAQEKTGA